jgi:HK97 family phage major capsid protein
MVTLNKKMKDLREQINTKTSQAKAFLADGEGKDVDKATQLLNEADALEKEYDAEKRLFEREQEEAKKLSGEQLGEKKRAEITSKFASTVRGMVRKDGTVTAMTEGVAADGGYTVPEDISTKIEKYPVEDFSVEPYIDTETVKTNKGARTYEKKGTVTPFVAVDEGGAIPAAATPKFERLTYSIGDMGGMVPITNDLLSDSDANLEAYLVEHLRKKEIATINSEFFTTMTAGESTAIATLKDIKTIVNVTIGSAYNCLIMTNDDGYNWLDCLEDKNGRPLLTPCGDVNNRVSELSIGGSIHKVVRVPNSVWASSQTDIPFIIGDIKAAFKRFKRLGMQIKISDVASIQGFNAFEQNGALIRAFLRDDAKIRDSDAFVFAELPLSVAAQDEEDDEQP